MTNVIYMELDFQDGNYKSPNNNDSNYALGELFITSTSSTPDKEYKVQAYDKDQLTFETLYLINSHSFDQSFLYYLPIDRYNTHLHFRAYRVKNTSFANCWILFELKPTPTQLDLLEENENFNLVGSIQN